jgi:hypothetical protein
MSNHSIIQKESVFGQPMFGLEIKELISDVSTYFVLVPNCLRHLLILDCLGFSYKDLQNPLVVPHLEFVPEEAHGSNIYKLSQSAKWLKHLDSDLRVQMVEENNKHFYIFEPVQLKNCEIIIPVFFHTENEKLHPKNKIKHQSFQTRNTHCPQYFF